MTEILALAMTHGTAAMPTATCRLPSYLHMQMAACLNEARDFDVNVQGWNLTINPDTPHERLNPVSAMLDRPGITSGVSEDRGCAGVTELTDKTTRASSREPTPAGGPRGRD